MVEWANKQTDQTDVGRPLPGETITPSSAPGNSGPSGPADTPDSAGPIVQPSGEGDLAQVSKP